MNSYKYASRYIIDKARVEHNKLKKHFEWVADQPAFENIHDPLTVYRVNGLELGSDQFLLHHIAILPKPSDQQGYDSDGDFVEEDNPRHAYFNGKSNAWSDAVPAPWNQASRLNKISATVVHKSWNPSAKSTKNIYITKKQKKKKK